MGKAPIVSADAGLVPASASATPRSINRWPCWSTSSTSTKNDPPTDLFLAIAEIPEDVTRERVDSRDLPNNWRDAAAPPELTRFGDQFVSAGETSLLFVPSVLARNEKQLPDQSGSSGVWKNRCAGVGAASYDKRMFEKRAHRVPKKS